MKYAVCFFPLVGGLAGGLVLLWYLLCQWLTVGSFLRAVGAVALPLLLTGGIHMDGFCDTVDALASHQSRERKLEILKDSHTGAFAIIFCALWLIADLGGWAELEGLRGWTVVCLGFVLSRAMSGLALTNLKGARAMGMLQSFADAAHKRVVTAVMVGYLVLAAGLMLWLAPIQGGAALVCAGLCLLYYRRMAYSQFGGVTGDLAGYFTQLCELAVVLAVALTGGIQG